MSGFSIWLMPCASDEAALQEVIDLLSQRFASPRFRPHLTLTGKIESGVNELTDFISRATEGIGRFRAEIEDIGTSDLYFRSFYAQFERSDPMTALYESMTGHAASGEQEVFMPHISLSYGVDDTAEKRAARQHCAKKFAGQKILFDRVCVAEAGEGIAIGDWSIRSTIPLGPSTQAD